MLNWLNPVAGEAAEGDHGGAGKGGLEKKYVVFLKKTFYFYVGISATYRRYPHKRWGQPPAGRGELDGETDLVSNIIFLLHGHILVFADRDQVKVLSSFLILFLLAL